MRPARAPVELTVPALATTRLARLGAPWTREHIRRSARDADRLLLDLSACTPEELVDAWMEVVRLALRLPRLEVVVAPGTVAGVDLSTLWDAHSRGTRGLTTLREAWLDEVEHEGLLRQLDDAPRRLVFGMLAAAWRREDPGWSTAPDKATALALAERLLGEREGWMKVFRQYTFDAIHRMVVIPTWQCELRCTYCFIPKQDGRVMSRPIMERSVDMLLGTERDSVVLQFFGGEALLEYANVQHCIDYAVRRAEEEGKGLEIVVSSNGWSLDREKLDWLAQRPVRLELSLDGARETQERYRPSRWKDRSSYDDSIATHAADIVASGIDHYVIMVVHPTNLEPLYDNFFHLVDLGFRSIQINNMLGRLWSEEQKKQWADGLFRIGKELVRRWEAGEAIEFVNTRHRPMAMRLNGELTVDWDGTLFGGNGFLHETEHKDKFVVGHLDDRTNVDRYFMDATANGFLLDWSYRPKVTANNLEVGRIMASMCTWLRKQGDPNAG